MATDADPRRALPCLASLWLMSGINGDRQIERKSRERRTLTLKGSCTEIEPEPNRDADSGSDRCAETPTCFFG
jgi:hypothetical protein